MSGSDRSQDISNAKPKREERPTQLARAWRWLSVAGLGLSLLMLTALHFMEPTNGLVFAWYYAPKFWVVICLLVLSAPGWFWGRGLGALMLAAAVLWAWPGLGWQLPRLRPHVVQTRPSPVLRVLTCNRGESDGHNFFPFVAQQNPDVLVVQQARSMGAWQPDAAELAARPHGIQAGEFLVRSKFPIMNQQLLVAGVVVAKSGPKQVVPGLRCEVDAGPLGRVVVYNVHLPSPRQVFRDMGIGASVTSSGSISLTSTMEVRRYWELHTECARLIRTSIQSETLPLVAMGDWNNPDHGPLYREFTDGLLDAHREAGRGYGYTFPEDVSHWLAGGRSWLRIDYILANPAWQVADFVVEGNAEQAQHHALAAALTLVK
jgi:hypothetical protein